MIYSGSQMSAEFAGFSTHAHNEIVEAVALFGLFFAVGSARKVETSKWDI
jgi:hypothetical protein